MSVFDYVSDEIINNTNCKKRKVNEKDIKLKKLNNSYTSMRVFECIFSGLIEKYSTNKLLVPILDDAESWLNYNKFSGDGTYGVVSNFKFLNKYDIAIKTIGHKYKENESEINNFIIEYFMGLEGINKLRMYCPNFCYTIGTFLCNSDEEHKICGKGDFLSQYICYEMIDGTPLYEMENISVEMFFNILVQLIIALEIAQRENNFTHYDLSYNNIMISNKKSDYTVLLDDNEYIFNKTNIAVIIDYGFSVIKHKNKYIHTDRNKSIGKKYGKENYPLPGFDLYFLLAQGLGLNKEIKKFVKTIMNTLYGDINPYAKRNGEDQWYGKITKTNIVSIPPLQLIQILLNEYYNMFKPSNITIKPRKTLDVSGPFDLLERYKLMTGITINNNCTKDLQSYLLCKYFNVKTNNDMVKNDIADFLTYKNIKILDIPDPTEILSARKLNKYITIYNECTDMFPEIEKYINIIYLIYQTKSIKKFKQYIDEFLNSDIYKHYKKHHISVMITRRWIDTLINK